ncbi:MAG: thioesterase family protein [Bacteroidota bacterium]
MYRFESTITVGKDDLDELDHVNNVTYVKWIQEVSREHWHSVTDTAISEVMVWVVREHHITYVSPARIDEILTAVTYIQKTKGPISTRIVEIRNNKTNKLVVTSSTDWCLLDAKTFRPKRVPEFIKKRFDP